MKTVATIQANLDETPIGTRSRLADDLGGMTILRRTVERVGRAESVDAVYVLCPSAQIERCESLLVGTGSTVRAHAAQTAPWRTLVQTARKWSLNGWRGGVGGTTTFDEYTDCQRLSAFLATVEADVVLSVPAAAPLFDPELADRMVDHRRQTAEGVRLVFTQAPPGLAGLLLDVGLIHELAQKSHPISWTFRYHPDNPQKDLIFQPCCYEAPRALRHASGRLIADTDRAVHTIAAVLDRYESPDSTTVGQWLMEREATWVEPLPREVEIELTTDDPYPAALLRPRGPRAGDRGSIDPAYVEQVAVEISRYDDALMVLGGFGDPLRHPQFLSVLEKICADRGVGRGLYGVAVRTAAVDLHDEYIDALITHGVDVVEVTLDAWTPELYARLQSPDHPTAANLEAVLARLDRLERVRGDRASVRPLVVPHFTKSRDNVSELDDFHDGWLRRLGAVTIGGHSHFAGQFEDRSVITMAPSTRIGCRRIGSRCVVLADGRVALCDQDLRGVQTVGNLEEHTLPDTWQSEAFQRIRRAHQCGRFHPTPLCRACGDWHRP